MQNEILLAFNRAYQFPKGSKISKITGLNKSRVYRILAGSEMSISEYEIFFRAIYSKENILFLKIFNVLKLFGHKELSFFYRLMKKNLELKKVFLG